MVMVICAAGTVEIKRYEYKIDYKVYKVQSWLKQDETMENI